MTEWTRADRDLRCGACPREIPRGAPVRVTTVVGVTHKFLRCPECAGEDPPPDLVALPPQPPPARLLPLAMAIPVRTRGALRSVAQRGWMPYKDTDR